MPPAAGTMAATTPSACVCDCPATQTALLETIGRYAPIAVSQLAIVRDALSLASTLGWSGPAGEAFHERVTSLAPRADSYESDIAGVARLCGQGAS